MKLAKLHGTIHNSNIKEIAKRATNFTSPRAIHYKFIYYVITTAIIFCKFAFRFAFVYTIADFHPSVCNPLIYVSPLVERVQKTATSNHKTEADMV